MGDRIIHAPLSASTFHKAVDIGCGTGIVTHEIASQFPNAQVYGLDLSPVPNIREKLPNIEYVEANIVDIATPDEPDARFKQASFDYIFSRFLVVGMTEWEKYIAQCVALAKPGVCVLSALLFKNSS
jgi:trans-aconitate methyltransferase